MEDRTKRYLQVIREVHKSHTTYDMHIHPLEVFFNPLDYEEDQELKGLFSLGKMKYSRPTFGSVSDSWAREEAGPSHELSPRVLRFFLRRRYYHTGPFVFRSILDIAEIDKGLLLPVAPENGSLEIQMKVLFRMYSSDKRFRLAGSVPNTVGNDEVKSFLKTQKDTYAIVAVKVHPNLTGINLKETRGKDRIECIIEACSLLNMPLILHSGRSNHLSGSASRFAEIENIKNIDLRARVPVVIAHGGAYGMSSSEVMDVVIPQLRGLLAANDNLYVDISGLNYELISCLLESIEIERILFGSDALYENVFTMEMRLLAALESAHFKMEESFMKITSENIKKTIFRWE